MGWERMEDDVIWDVGQCHEMGEDGMGEDGMECDEM